MRGTANTVPIRCRDPALLDDSSNWFKYRFGIFLVVACNDVEILEGRRPVWPRWDAMEDYKLVLRPRPVTLRRHEVEHAIRELASIDGQQYFHFDSYVGSVLRPSSQCLTEIKGEEPKAAKGNFRQRAGHAPRVMRFP